MATVSNSNFMTFTNFNTTNLEANASTIEVIAADNRREKITLEEIIDEHNIRVKEDLSEMTSEGTKEANVYIDNQLFIYGQVVHDFVFSKKLLYGQSPQQPSNRSTSSNSRSPNFGVGNCHRKFAIFSCREQIQENQHSMLLRPAVPCLNFVPRKVHLWVIGLSRSSRS